MITNCITTLQAAAELRAAGLVAKMFDLGCYEDGRPKCLVCLSRPLSTQFLQEVTMSHKTRAAMVVAAQSCACHGANNYGDNSTTFLTMQEEDSKKTVRNDKGGGER